MALRVTPPLWSVDWCLETTCAFAAMYGLVS